VSGSNWVLLVLLSLLPATVGCGQSCSDGGSRPPRTTQSTSDTDPGSTQQALCGGSVQQAADLCSPTLPPTRYGDCQYSLRCGSYDVSYELFGDWAYECDGHWGRIECYYDLTTGELVAALEETDGVHACDSGGFGEYWFGQAVECEPECVYGSDPWRSFAPCPASESTE
jgi:hypothetical protein